MSKTTSSCPLFILEGPWFNLRGQAVCVQSLYRAIYRRIYSSYPCILEIQLVSRCICRNSFVSPSNGFESYCKAYLFTHPHLSLSFSSPVHFIPKAKTNIAHTNIQTHRLFLLPNCTLIMLICVYSSEHASARERTFSFFFPSSSSFFSWWNKCIRGHRDSARIKCIPLKLANGWTRHPLVTMNFVIYIHELQRYKGEKYG